jgi:hypothetical protein
MGANIAGIYGAQIFRQDDKPRYRRGFSINIGVLAFGLFLATVRFIDDFRRRRRGDQLENASGRSSSERQSEEGDLAEVPVVDEKGRPLSRSQLSDQDKKTSI